MVQRGLWMEGRQRGKDWGDEAAEKYLSRDMQDGLFPLSVKQTHLVVS